MDLRQLALSREMHSTHVEIKKAHVQEGTLSLNMEHYRKYENTNTGRKEYTPTHQDADSPTAEMGPHHAWFCSSICLLSVATMRRNSL